MSFTSLKRTAPAIVHALLICVIAQAGVAFCGTFHVNPIRISLSRQTSSTLLSVRNQSGEKARFQIAVFTWEQDPRGEMVLSPTNDIIFYPTLLALEPGDQRNIRIGTNNPVAATEKAYRIFVEELPSLDKAEVNGVRILTKMGVPVFIEPTQANLRGQIGQMNLLGTEFSFEIKNEGNIHFVPRGVRVKGIGPEGESFFERQVRAWYILAGGTREYKLEIPQAACLKIRQLIVEVELQGKVLTGIFPLPADACRG